MTVSQTSTARPDANAVRTRCRTGAPTPRFRARDSSSDGIRANPDLRDAKNKDESLRTRRLAGIQMLSGFTRGSGEWTGGTIYNADDGGTYKATVTPTDAEHIKVKGCIVWPLCKTQTWTRIR